MHGELNNISLLLFIFHSRFCQAKIDSILICRMKNAKWMNKKKCYWQIHHKRNKHKKHRNLEICRNEKITFSEKKTWLLLLLLLLLLQNQKASGKIAHSEAFKRLIKHAWHISSRWSYLFNFQWSISNDNIQQYVPTYLLK